MSKKAYSFLAIARGQLLLYGMLVCLLSTQFSSIALAAESSLPVTKSTSGGHEEPRGREQQTPMNAGRINYPAWPLDKLSSDQRMSRIKFLLRSNRFAVETESIGATEGCSQIFENLENGNFNVLAAVTEGSPKISDDGSLELCPNLVPGTVYSGPDFKFDLLTDKKFSSLNADMKIKNALYWKQARNNFEFFDIAKYLGKDAWAFLGEGVRWSCDDKICHQLDKGMRGYKGLMGKIFNTKTCAQTQLPLDRVFRLDVVSRNSPDGTLIEDFYETPNFSAYVDVLGKLYLLSAAEFRAARNPVRAETNQGTLLIVGIESPGETPRAIQCKFKIN